MSGIGMVLNTAKGALVAQQVGLNVAGHNIANVNTPHYSRQSVPHTSKEPVLMGGLLLGRGVDVEQVQRASDQLLENRLAEQKSNLAAFKESEAYINIMESLFNENSDLSLNSQMAQFWNSWHDLSNNPAGISERDAVFEKGTQLAELFDTLNADLIQMETDLTRETEAAVSQINIIAKEIAAINSEIVGLEVNRTANDQRDRRNALVTELSELINIRTLEQPDGTLNIITGKGYLLVNKTDTFALEVSEGGVKWEGSYGGKIDITDTIGSGKIGGWLDIRDEVIPKAKAELDVLAGAFAWSVNYQHSQGVGLEYFSTAVTGTYATAPNGLLSTLPFGNKIDFSKDFKMWINDGSGAPPAEVLVDLSIIARTGPSPALALSNTANSILDSYQFIVTSVTGTGTIGTDQIEIEWSNSVSSGVFALDAGMTAVNVDGVDIGFNAGDAFSAGDVFTLNTDLDGNPSAPDNMTLDDFINQFNLNAAGLGVSASKTAENTLRFTPAAGHSFAFSDDAKTGFEDAGLTAALGINSFFQGHDAMTIAVSSVLTEKDYIAAARIDATNGDYGVGDNSNALALADLQFETRDLPQWFFDRGQAGSSTALKTTLQDYHQSMIGSIGIKSASITRSRDFSEVMVSKIGEQRDALSAVSLDEEMVNLMKYQHAYTAAAKLLNVADEMLATLIATR